MHDLRRSNRHPLILVATSAVAAVVVATVATRSCEPQLDPPPLPAWDAGVPQLRDAGALEGSDADPDASRVSDGFDGAEAIVWPAAPRIEREVDAINREQLEAAIAVPGTRVRAFGDHDGILVLGVSDVAIELASGARIERLLIAQGVHRVSISGGEVGSIELAPPIRFGDREPRVIDDLWVRDVRIESVRITASDSALVVRGHRIAIVNVDVVAERYCVWVGDTMGVPSEDIRIASSRLASAGPEATVRMHDVVRAIVVDSRLSNTLKHNVRLHGRSDMVFIGRNVLVGTGAMMANQAGDQLERIWFVGNTVHQRREGTLVVAAEQLTVLTAMENVVYTDAFSEFEHGYPDAPPRWRVERNRIAPFVEPSTP